MQLTRKQQAELKVYIILLYRKYLKLYDSYVVTKGKDNVIHISYKGLNDAITEILTDIQILSARRNFAVFSRGKIAGIIVFRLSRWNIINSDYVGLLENEVFLKMNFIIAMLVGLAYAGISYADIHGHISTEIQYTLMRRHVNQETLGLVFDILRTSNK